VGENVGMRREEGGERGRCAHKIMLAGRKR
jgi:hypothetical protein